MLYLEMTREWRGIETGRRSRNAPIWNVVSALATRVVLDDSPVGGRSGERGCPIRVSRAVRANRDLGSAVVRLRLMPLVWCVAAQTYIPRALWALRTSCSESDSSRTRHADRDCQLFGVRDKGTSSFAGLCRYRKVCSIRNADRHANVTACLESRRRSRRWS
jgi:hypothetical protein